MGSLMRQSGANVEMRVSFLGGPLDGRVAFVSRLDPKQVFVHSRNKMILAYFRHNEVSYVYDHSASQSMAQDFEATTRQLSDLHKTDPPATVRFEESA